MKSVQRYDGETFSMNSGQSFYLECCDCGLVHKVKIDLQGDRQEWVNLTTWRDKRRTQAQRKIKNTATSRQKVGDRRG